LLEVPHGAAIRYAKLLAHIYAGSGLMLKPGETGYYLKAQVNGGAWQFVELHPYMDDSAHWIEIPVNPTDFRTGNNMVILDSTIFYISGAKTSGIELFATTLSETSERALYKDPGGNWQLLSNQLWNVRLWYSSLDNAKWQPISVPGVWEGNFTSDKEDVKVCEDKQLLLKINDQDWIHCNPGYCFRIGTGIFAC